MNQIQPRIWIKNEPFLNGAICYQITNHINSNTLRKTLNYAKTKGLPGYPKIEYSIWRYIAVNKINIPEHIAWMYFETYYLLTKKEDDPNDGDSVLLKCKNDDEYERLKETRRINLYEFILLLYIQSYYSIDIKSSSIYHREEWPSNASSNRIDDIKNRKNKNAHNDELSYYNFILKNLDDIFSLFQISKDDELTHEHDDVLNSLNLLFNTSVIVNGTQKFYQFSSLIKQPFILNKFKDGVVTISNIIQLLRNYLEINPYEINSAPRSFKRLTVSCSIANNLNPSLSSDQRRAGKILSNLHIAPKIDQMVIIAQVAKQTIIECSDQFKDVNLFIQRCIYSNLYILAPLRSCHIKRCRKTIIFVGCVENVVTIENCIECTIISVCRRLTIKNSSACTLHLLTSMKPILMVGCDMIQIGPYNTHYSLIERHIQQVGLSSEMLNKFDKPVQLTSSATNIQWSFISPLNFTLFSIPIEEIQKGSKLNLSHLLVKNQAGYYGRLPLHYEEALREREKNLEENLKLIQNTDLSTDQCMLLQKYIDQGFKEWLNLSGTIKQLEQLTVLQTAHSQMLS